MWKYLKSFFLLFCVNTLCGPTRLHCPILVFPISRSFLQFPNQTFSRSILILSIYVHFGLPLGWSFRRFVIEYVNFLRILHPPDQSLYKAHASCLCIWFSNFTLLHSSNNLRILYVWTPPIVCLISWSFSMLMFDICSVFCYFFFFNNVKIARYVVFFIFILLLFYLLTYY